MLEDIIIISAQDVCTFCKILALDRSRSILIIQPREYHYSKERKIMI